MPDKSSREHVAIAPEIAQRLPTVRWSSKVQIPRRIQLNVFSLWGNSETELLLFHYFCFILPNACGFISNEVIIAVGLPLCL